jgi:hypothetical protein
MHQDIVRDVESEPAKRNVESWDRISASDSRPEISVDRFDLTTSQTLDPVHQ